jgi:hypothetical protein
MKIKEEKQRGIISIYCQCSHPLVIFSLEIRV